MKQLITITLAVFLCIPAIAVPEKVIESKIEKVTVFREGAEVNRQANIYLSEGKTTLLFKGLSSKLDAKSIQAKGNKNLMIVSVSHTIDYLNKVKISQKMQILEDQKVVIKDSLSLLAGLHEVYSQEKQLILANKKIGGDNGVDIAELQSAAEFFRKRLMEIEHKTRHLTKNKENLNKQFTEISRQLIILNSKSDAPTSKVKVVVSAKVAGNYKLDLNYLVNQAGWEPNYDLRINSVNKPMNIFYKAKVRQSSGEEWENVKLILSTGNPKISNTKPSLSTYFLTFDNYYRNVNKYTAQPIGFTTSGNVYGRITDAATGEPLPGVNVVIKGTTVGTVSDLNGNYQISAPHPNTPLVFSFIGCTTEEAYINNPGQLNIVMNQDVSVLEEVVVVGYGSSNKIKIRGMASGISRQKAHIPLAIEKRQTSTEFEIEIPYNIPSDNQSYDVTMVEFEAPANYNYNAVPKLSDDAYLTAKIPDWTQYELINGPANLFFEGVYQGETYLNMKEFEDTLNISVGRDKDLVISRELQKDFSKTSSIGLHKKELKAWKITIKNNKNTEINLVLEDQFPISKVDDIKVDQIEFSGAELNEDDGTLTWNLTLAPKEKKTLLVKYEVKYPKNRNLIVD